MNRARIALVSVLALFVLLIVMTVTPAQGEPEPDARCKGSTQVTNYNDIAPTADSRNHGPVGSLRFILYLCAKPGDRITFDRPGTIQLTHTLAVPSRLGAITIDGEVAGARAAIRSPHKDTALLLQAEGMTASHLVFQNLQVGATGPGSATPPGVKVLHNRFEGSSSLSAFNAVRLSVRNNEFAGRRGVGLINSLRSHVKGNTFEGGAGVYDSMSDRLTVASNTFAGGPVNLQSDSLTVLSNVFTDVAVGFVGKSGRGARVQQNTFNLSKGRIALGPRGKLQFLRNTVTGSGGKVVMGRCAEASSEDRGHRRLLRIEGNTLRKAGIEIDCSEPNPTNIEVLNNTVRGVDGTGILVADGDNVNLRGNRVSGNTVGITFFRGTSGIVEGGSVKSNTVKGVWAHGNSLVQIFGTKFGANSGPGIDLAPAGITPNSRRKTANRNLGWPKSLKFEKEDGKLRGVTCSGCKVDIWEAEEGDENGEGLRVIGRVTAARSGKFVYPPRGELKCPDSGLVTVTATQPGKPSVTSEFSEDVECACVFKGEFEVDPHKAPNHGWYNPGLIINFKDGTKVEHGVLTDTKTEERPPTDAFPSPVVWEEFQKAGNPEVAGFNWEVFVSISNPSDTIVPSNVQVWQFAVPYEPPASDKTCSAKLWN